MASIYFAHIRALNGVADMTVTTTPTALPALSAGQGGLTVRSHPNNDPASRMRVATNAAANIGQVLAPGESFTFNVADASDLMACLEMAVSGDAILIPMQA